MAGVTREAGCVLKDVLNVTFSSKGLDRDTISLIASNVKCIWFYKNARTPLKYVFTLNFFGIPFPLVYLKVTGALDC